MSTKRKPETDLNRDNWDQEDKPEEAGEFQKASKDVLKNRVIKTAKRRATVPSDSERKPIFSGFSGFAASVASKKPSFSFITNSLKNADTDDTSKPAFSFSAGSNFNTAKSELKTSFSTTSNKSNSASSVLEVAPQLSTKLTPSAKPSFSFGSDSAQSLSMFGKAGSASNQPEIKKTNDGINSNNKAKLNELSDDLQKTVNEKHSEHMANRSEKTPDEVFLQKIRSLNLLCAEWIIKHLNENLSYILTPIFDDYKKHLTQLREERQRSSSSCKKPRTTDEDVVSSTKSVSASFAPKASELKCSVPKFNFGSSVFPSNHTEEKEKSVGFKFTNSIPAKDTSGFKFSTFSEKKDDDAVDTCSSAENKTSGLFEFGCNQKDTKTASDSSDVKSSFFSFSANSPPANPFLKQTDTPAASETIAENEDEPPRVKDVTITEDGAVYDTKCKLFIKKDGDYVDHGVGFLFVKLVGDEQKCQVIVRANNQLATVIVNTLLNSSIPVQKAGKNNVLIVCCPTPDSKPTSVLIRVKTTEDAEELLNVLQKYIK